MESELMLSILSSLAESESVSISENEKWGIKKRFQNGTFIISYPPYGYGYCKVLQPYFSLKPYIFKEFTSFANKKAMTPYFRV